MKTLEIGSVYLYNNKTYLFVKNKFRREKRIIFELVKLRSDGSFGQSTLMKFKADMFKKVDSVKVEVRIHVPRVDSHKIQYEALVEEVHEYLQLFKKKKISKKDARYKMAQNCLTAITLYNKEDERNYNLRDFAKSLEMKRYLKAYQWVASTMTERVHQDAKNAASLSDRSVNMIYNNYRKYLPSMAGFNKDLNLIIKKNIKLIIQEKKKRGI